MSELLAMIGKNFARHVEDWDRMQRQRAEYEEGIAVVARRIELIRELIELEGEAVPREAVKG